jgi:hypothetical protein
MQVARRTGQGGRLVGAVEQAQQLVASRDRTPALADMDRELLGNML